MGRFDALVGITEAKTGVTYDEVTKALGGGGAQTRFKFKSYSNAKRVPGGFEVSFKSQRDAKALVKELGVGSVRKHTGQGRFWFADIPIAGAPAEEKTMGRFDEIAGLAEGYKSKGYVVLKNANVKNLTSRVFMREGDGQENQLVAAFRARGDAHLFVKTKQSSPVVKGGGKVWLEAEDSPPPSGAEGALEEAGPGPGLARFKHNKALAKKHGGVSTSAGVYSFPKRGKADAFINALRTDYPGLPTRAETKRIDGQMRFLVRFDEFRTEDEDDLTEAGASSDKKAIAHASQWLGKITGDINRTAKTALNAIYWPQGKAEKFRAGMKKAKQGVVDAQNALTQVSVGVKEGEDEDEDDGDDLTEAATLKEQMLASLMTKLALGLSLHKGNKAAAINYAKEHSTAGAAIWKLAKRQLGWAPGGEVEESTSRFDGLAGLTEACGDAHSGDDDDDAKKPDDDDESDESDEPDDDDAVAEDYQDDIDKNGKQVSKDKLDTLSSLWVHKGTVWYLKGGRRFINWGNVEMFLKRRWKASRFPDTTPEKLRSMAEDAPADPMEEWDRVLTAPEAVAQPADEADAPAA